MDTNKETVEEPEIKEVEPVKEDTEKPKDLRGQIQAVKEEIAAREPGEKPAKKTLSLPAKPGKTEKDAVSELKPSSKPPVAWKPEMREKFNGLPPEVQKYITDREEEVHRGFTKQDDERNLGRSVKEVITPYMPIITAEGGTPLTAIKDLLNTAYVMRTAPPAQKSQLFARLAQQYGVDLRSVAQPAQNVPPVVKALQDEVAKLQAHISTEQTQRQQADYWRQQQEQTTVNSLIHEFQSNPANVHFEQVRPLMSALLQSGQAQDLQDAYDKAIYATPEIRAQILEADKANQEAQRIANAKSKVDAARKAGSSVNGGPGVAVPNHGSPDRSLADDLRANYKAMVG